MKKYPKAVINYKLSRRKFISGGAILGASAVAAVAIPSAAVAAVKQDSEVDNDNKKEEGYRLTEHIADYYKSAAL